MNGYEICKAAHLRLGYDNPQEITLHNNSSKRDLEFINQIAEDLNIKPLEELSEKTDWNSKQTTAVISGVAMLMSFIDGETEKNRVFTAIYNAKRASLLGGIEKIKDTLPVSESGDI